MNYQIIEELADLIRYHKNLYYTGNVEISDDSYDSLEKELKELDPNHSVFSEVGAPVSTKNKVKHREKMLSLDNARSEEEFEKKFFNEVKRTGGFKIISHKMDGFAVSLIYERISDGSEFRLIQGCSRGDGEYGEDITENIKQISNIPKIILDGICEEDILEVRGEVVISKKTFNQLKEDGIIEDSANIRNICAGSCRTSDIYTTRERKLSFVAYSMHYDSDREYRQYVNYDTDLYRLQRLGFEVVPYAGAGTLKDMKLEYEKILKNRESFDYEIDGVVFRVNCHGTFKDLGYTSHHPKGAIAWKFPSMSATTQLTHVEWNTTRTGLINPVAVFKPVVIGGAKITRATLFNLTNMEDLHLTENCTIEITRQQDVIPYVKSKIHDSNVDHVIQVPTVCPECGERASIETKIETSVLKCRNSKCPAIAKDKILHWCKSLSMKGISEASISSLFDAGIVEDIEDLYSLFLCVDRMLNISKWGKKKVTETLATIDKTKKCGIKNFIMGLGIPECGEGTAKNLAEDFMKTDESPITNIVEYLTTMKSFEHVPDIGEIVSGNIISFVKENREMIETLHGLVDVQYSTGEAVPLIGLSFCITGSLSKSRNEFKEMIESNGGTFKSSITNDLDYLIVGENPGSKVGKAEKKGVQIWNEQKFLDFIGEISDNENEEEEEGLF